MTTDLLAKMRAAADATIRRPGQRCATCQLPADVLAALDVLHTEGKLAPYLSVAAKASGHPVSVGSIRRHYRECVE